MPQFFGYFNVILGPQSTVNGSAQNYAFAPPNGGTWTYTGDTTSFHVRENDGASQFNGDPTNEQVSAQEQIGGTWEQVTLIDGSYRQVIWDYTFEVTAADGTVYRVAVIDVDLNNDDDLNDAGEDGYFLVFPDGVPPAGQDYTIGGIVENDASTPHSGLGSTAVCYASGTLIDTAQGPRTIETLGPGDLVRTKENGMQPILWHGVSRTRARGRLAPVVIRDGALGNTRDLVVSPQHRMLIESVRAELLFGTNSVLVKARDLIDDCAIYRRIGGWVDYHHILLPRHEIIFAEGIPSESFHPGTSAIESLTPDNRRALFAAFPALRDDIGAYGLTARQALKTHEALCLAA